MSVLRDAALVAWFDLWESVRSRKFLALLVIHLAGAMVATATFVEVLKELENTLAEQLAVASTDKAGTMTRSLMESEQFQEVLGNLLRDPELAAELVTVPPIALFYGWLALFGLPALVVFTSSDAISSELSTGSARFALFRTSRTAWAFGKLGGQTLLMAIMVFAGAAGVWLVAALSMASFEGPETAWWLVRLGGRACVYGFAFLGLSLGVSQMTSSVNGSRAMGLFALIGVSVAGSMSQVDHIVEFAPLLIDGLSPIWPNVHKIDLWRPQLVERAPAAAMLVALGLSYFMAGHAVLLKRDA